MSGEKFTSVNIVPGNNVRHVTFGVGRGQQHSSLRFGKSVIPGNVDCTPDQSMLNPTMIPAASSTPVASANGPPGQVFTVEALGGMISNLAKQIGDNITANLNATHQPSPTPAQSHCHQSPSHCDPSQMKIVVQSDIKAPPYFRGDHTDSFTIHEWEDMMRCYIGRMSCETHTAKLDLIMSRLTGKARDMVKVSLRSHPELSGAELPDAVFDILKRHFSELICSSLPMRDFYGTVPRAGEEAMDYWIRLNKSIDAADECLRRRGKSVENPSAEVVMMFISHCPDPVLAMSFQLKAPEQWTAAEVQDRLDSHVRKINRTSHSQRTLALSSHCQSPVDVSTPHPCSSTAQGPAGSHSPAPPTVAPSQPQSGNTTVCRQQPSSQLPVHTPPPAAESDVQQVVAVFDRVLSLCTASLASNQKRPQQPSYPRGHQGAQHVLCRVCGSGEHSTHSHCRLYRLCLTCYSPGHQRRECPKNSHVPTVSAPAPSSAALN